MDANRCELMRTNHPLVGRTSNRIIETQSRIEVSKNRFALNFFFKFVFNFSYPHPKQGLYVLFDMIKSVLTKPEAFLFIYQS